MKRIDWNALDEREREAVLRRPVQAVSDAGVRGPRGGDLRGCGRAWR
jgi:predicted Fe-S protein YdhL (DUF1289 family)